MLRLIALIISIVLQLIAVFISLRLTKVTKYKISWILISVGFVFMAFRRLIDLFQFMNRPALEELNLLNDWIAVLISILIASGVIIIPEIFNYMRRVDQEKTETEKKVLNAIIATEEKERKRFAKDLHDGLGPLLSGIKMAVSALQQNEKDESRLEIINNTQSLVHEAIVSIKDISNNLSPHVLSNFGLASAVSNFIEKIADKKLVKIDFKTNMKVKRFDTNTEVVLYRIICELIHNTLKHADAEKILINLSCKNDTLDLLYDDDGKGFDYNKDSVRKSKGMGLKNLLSRLDSIHAYYEIESEPGKGFHAYLNLKV